MISMILWFASVAALLAGTPATPGWVDIPAMLPTAQDFRPVSLGDLVKAVGTNRDGVDELDLTRHVADHAMYVGDGIGVAARFKDDPDGAIFVGWRAPGELWRYRFLEEHELDVLRTDAGEGVRLGRIESLRPYGGSYVLETHPTPSTTSSIVMRGDLSPIAHVFASVKLALPSGALVVASLAVREGARVHELAVLDASTRRLTTFYALSPKSPAHEAFAARLAPMHAIWAVRDPERAGSSGSAFDVSMSRFQLDEGTDTLRFTATLASRHPPEIAAPLRVEVAVLCRGIGRQTPMCEETQNWSPLDRFVESRAATTDRGADERTLLAASDRADGSAGASRSADHERCILPGTSLVNGADWCRRTR